MIGLRNPIVIIVLKISKITLNLLNAFYAVIYHLFNHVTVIVTIISSFQKTIGKLLAGNTIVTMGYKFHFTFYYIIIGQLFLKVNNT